MAKIPFFPIPAVLAGLLLLGGCATTGYNDKDMIVAPHDDEGGGSWSNPDARFTAEVWSDAPPPRIGDFLKLKLRASDDAYLSLYAIHTSGRTSRLLDNQFVRGGRTVPFPGPYSRVDFALSPPPGDETYLLVATQKPLRWLAPDDIRERGSLTELNLTGKELQQRLRAVLDRQNPYSWNVAVLNQPLRP